MSDEKRAERSELHSNAELHTNAQQHSEAPLDSRAQLQKGAEELGLTLSSTQRELFCRFSELLREWNEKINLTRIPESEWTTLHYLDSLVAAPMLRTIDAKSVVDVGTGGGFPGVPLAIALPHIHFTLIDGTLKRIRFLEEVRALLPLPNITPRHIRAEDLGRENRRFDVAIARAVAPLPKLISYLIPLVKRGGRAIALKSEDIDGEIKSARGDGYSISLTKCPLPFTDIRRSIVVIERGER